MRLSNLRPTVKFLEWGVPSALAVSLCLLLPLGTALEVGADEGYELMKAFLVSLGHPLYVEIWNDQPPLHTELVAMLFRAFGPSAYVGRLLSVAFATILLGTFFKLANNRSGLATGLVAVILLFSSPFFIHLSASVMLELPAMALAVASVWAYSEFVVSKSRMWLAFSGLLCGCAVQVKWTAVIVLPAMAVDCLVYRMPPNDGFTNPVKAYSRNLLCACQDALVWLGCFCLAAGTLLGSLAGWGTLRIFWMSHFSHATRVAADSVEYSFQLMSLASDPALLIPAAAGVAIIVFKRRWNLLFPIALLVTVVSIHLLNRPYWYYYQLHFSIPLAWLGAIGIVECSRKFCSLRWPPRPRLPNSRNLISCTLCAMAVAVEAFFVSDKALNELQRASVRGSALDDIEVVALRKRAADTHWVFTNRLIVAFWAGLPVPPELAVIPAKRIWSGQISHAYIITCLERYKPEQILLSTDWASKFQLTNYINENYESNLLTNLVPLFVRKHSNEGNHGYAPESLTHKEGHEVNK